MDLIMWFRSAHNTCNYVSQLRAIRWFRSTHTIHAQLTRGLCIRRYVLKYSLTIEVLIVIMQCLRSGRACRKTGWRACCCHTEFILAKGKPVCQWLDHLQTLFTHPAPDLRLTCAAQTKHLLPPLRRMESKLVQIQETEILQHKQEFAQESCTSTYLEVLPYFSYALDMQHNNI